MIKKLCSILLTLSLLIVTSISLADEVFSVRNGVVFGDSIDVVKAKEEQDSQTSIRFDGTTDKTHQFIGDPKDVIDTDYLYYGGTILGNTKSHLYYFFDTSHNLEEISYGLMDGDFSEIKSILTSKYGDGLLQGQNGDVFPIIGNDLTVVMSIIEKPSIINRSNARLDDYQEWVVKLDDGSAVKIELISYVVDGTYKWLDINYVSVSAEQLSKIQSDETDRQNALVDGL